MSDIVVSFKAKGEKRLIEAINKLQRATGKHTTTIIKNTVATNKNRKSNSGLLKSQRLVSGSFATMRSHLLLFNFAMGLGISQIIKFGKEAAKIDSMKTAFVSLTGGVGSASIALDKLQEATNGTMSQFDLFQQANNAMILGVSKNSDEMAEMFDIAQRLGRALGKDTASSVESLITGIGRQSRLMLDNIGIIVKADEAYESYARKIGKSKDSLTDAEKKQAFMNATLDSARKKLSRLGDETLSTQDSYDKLGASLKDTGAEVGSIVNEAFIPLINASTKFFKSLDKETLRTLIELLTTVGLGFAALKGYALAAAGSMRVLNAIKVSVVAGFLALTARVTAAGARLISFGSILAAGRTVLATFLSVLTGISATTLGWIAILGGAIFGIIKWTGLFGSASDEAEDLDKNIKNVSTSMEEVSASPISQELQDFIDKMIETNELLEFHNRIMSEDLMKSFNQSVDITAMDLMKENLQSLKDEAILAEQEFKKLAKTATEGGTEADWFAAKQAQENLNSLNKEIEILEKRVDQDWVSAKFIPFITEADQVNLKNFTDLFTQVTGISKDFFQGAEAQTLKDSLGTVITSEEELLAVLSNMQKAGFELNDQAIQTIVLNFQKSKQNKKLKDETKDQMEWDDLSTKERLGHVSTLMKSFGVLAGSTGKNAKISARLAQAGAIIDTYAGANKAFKIGGPLGFITGAAIIAQGLANVAKIETQLSKMGGGGSAPQFAEGGYVGGKPHSQGGTIIEAERGEFVMSRNATESIGLETLNQMNQQGGSGSINVTVTGNVLTQDFVEGELAESIKEAVRRGSDFGLT